MSSLADRIEQLDRMAAVEKECNARAWRIVDRLLPYLPRAHGFYEPEEFMARVSRNNWRKRLWLYIKARLRAKAIGGVPHIRLPAHCEHIWAPGDALYDVSKFLESQAR